MNLGRRCRYIGYYFLYLINGSMWTERRYDTNRGLSLFGTAALLVVIVAQSSKHLSNGFDEGTMHAPVLCFGS